jgi:hypothetical protein
MLCGCSQAWIISPSVASTALSLSVGERTVLFAAAKSKPEDEEEGDSLLDRLEKIEQLGGSLSDSAAQAAAAAFSMGDKDMVKPKLGIDIGSQLKPFTDQEAAELKAAAIEVINDGVAEGIDEIERLRNQMKVQIDKQKKQMELASDMQLQREQARLMSKIDKMTGDFLDKTRATRDETKLIAQADKSQEGRGVELGVWGMIGGAAVVTTGSKNVGLLGSVDNAKLQAERQAKKQRDQQITDLKKPTSTADEDVVVVNNNRIVIVADTSQVSPTSQQENLLSCLILKD